MKSHIKLLNGEILEVENENIKDIKEIHEIVARHLDLSPWCVKIFEEEDEKDDDIKHFYALAMPKPTITFPSLRDTLLEDYSFLYECVNESFLSYVLDIVDDPSTSSIINEDGQSLDSLLWRSLVKNPHPLVVDAIFKKDIETWEHSTGLSGNPSDRVIDFVFSHPHLIHAPLFLTNSNPRVIEWVMSNCGNDNRFTTGQWYTFARYIVRTREQVDWVWSQFGNDDDFMRGLLFNASDACVDEFLRRFPTPESASEIAILPLSQREELVPYHLHRMNCITNDNSSSLFSRFYREFLAAHPDERVSTWLMDNIDRIQYSYLIMEEMYANPNDYVLDQLLNEENEKYKNEYKNVRKWNLGINPNPRAQEKFKTILKEVSQLSQISVLDILKLKEVVSFTPFLETLIFTLDVLRELKIEDRVNELVCCAFIGLSHSNEWVFKEEEKEDKNEKISLKRREKKSI